MKRLVKIIGFAIIVVGIGIQFVRPERSNPSEDPASTLSAGVAVPPAVQEILDRSCMDCHSNRTRWPFYSNIAPASWLVASDVHTARDELNFSEWGTYTTKRRIARMEMIVTEVDKGAMPPSQYLLLHRDADLTEEQKDILCDWAEQIGDSLKSTTE